MSNRRKQDAVTKKLEEAAEKLRERNPLLTKAKAVRQVIEDDPSWAEVYDFAARGDAKAQAAELQAGNRGE
jgi:hypothetical protein